MRAPPQLDSLQNGIAGLLFDRAGLEDPATTLEYRLSGDFPANFYALIGSLSDADEPASLVATLPRHSPTVFLTLARKHERDVARVLSNLEDLERETSKQLLAGGTVRLDGLMPGQTGPWGAVMLLRACSAAVLKELPDCTSVVGVHIRFLYVLPLSKEELRCRNEEGHDAMIDMFQREGKSIFFT